jgi:hypothetical protein
MGCIVMDWITIMAIGWGQPRRQGSFAMSSILALNRNMMSSDINCHHIGLSSTTPTHPPVAC